MLFNTCFLVPIDRLTKLAADAAPLPDDQNAGRRTDDDCRRTATRRSAPMHFGQWPGYASSQADQKVASLAVRFTCSLPEPVIAVVCMIQCCDGVHTFQAGPIIPVPEFNLPDLSKQTLLPLETHTGRAMSVGCKRILPNLPIQSCQYFQGC